MAAKRKEASLEERVSDLEARMEQMKAGLQQVLDLVEGMMQ